MFTSIAFNHLRYTHVVKLKLILNYPKHKELCCNVFLLAVQT